MNERDSRWEPVVTLLKAGRSRAMISSVDGIILRISRYRRNSIYLQLEEWRTGHRIGCYLNRERWLREVQSRISYEKHVTVYGTVTYNADGVPVTVTEVTAIDERSGSVKLSELEGRMPGLTGRLGPQGFIRKLRGGDA